MYSPPRSYGSPPPELSNNPFIDHPANALSRYPDIDGSDDPTVSTHFTSWMQRPSALNTPSSSFSGDSNPGQYGYNQQQVQPQPTSWGGQGSGFTGGGGYGQQQGYMQGPPPQQATGMPFQPSTAFGQQLVSQVSGVPSAGYGGYAQQQPQLQQHQYGGYASPTSPQPQFGAGYQQSYMQQPQQQQQQVPQQYVAEFDPLLSSGGQSGSGYGGGGGAGPGTGAGYRPPHPREYVQQHKAELEVWDGYAWKQVRLYISLAPASSGHSSLVFRHSTRSTR